jgi:hypothetical protein
VSLAIDKLSDVDDRLARGALRDNGSSSTDPFAFSYSNFKKKYCKEDILGVL